jgi:hypothetical protein
LRRPEGSSAAAAAAAAGSGGQGLVRHGGSHRGSSLSLLENPDALDSSLPSATAAAAAAAAAADRGGGGGGGGGFGGVGFTVAAAAAVAGGLAARVAALAEKWSQAGVLEALRNRFVTGDWAAGAERAAARPGGCSWVGWVLRVQGLGAQGLGWLRNGVSPQGVRFRDSGPGVDHGLGGSSGCKI